MTEPAPPQPAATPPNVSTSAPPQASAIDALLAMDLRLAGLTAAVEGFAARQQELHARDYAPELAVIQTQWERARKALDNLAAQPALALTPEDFAHRIEKASVMVRKADHDALTGVRHDMRQGIGTIGGLVASARTAQNQKKWLVGAAAGAMVFGCTVGAVIPSTIDRAVPESWYWPEQRAVSMLGRDGWNAGERLLALYDPDRWRQVDTAMKLYRLNADVLAKCTQRAAKAREPISCKVTISTHRELAGT